MLQSTLKNQEKNLEKPGILFLKITGHPVIDLVKIPCNIVINYINHILLFDNSVSAGGNILSFSFHLESSDVLIFDVLMF